MRRPPSGNWPTTRLDWITPSRGSVNKPEGAVFLFEGDFRSSTREFIFHALPLDTARCNARQNIFTVKLCHRDVSVAETEIYCKNQKSSGNFPIFRKPIDFIASLPFSSPFRTTRLLWEEKRSFFSGFHDFRAISF